VGYGLLEAMAPSLCRRYGREVVTEAVQASRGARIPVEIDSGSFYFDVEVGEGGLRDLELLTRGLQLLHSADSPGVLSPSTAAAIDAFGREGVLSRNRAGALRQYCRLLHRARGCLQLLFDRPADVLLNGERLPLLAARLPECASGDTDLRDALRRGSDLVRDLFREHLPGAWS
jgi:glutamine synthetase adenylyltransferase